MQILNFTIGASVARIEQTTESEGRLYIDLAFICVVPWADRGEIVARFRDVIKSSSI